MTTTPDAQPLGTGLWARALAVALCCAPVACADTPDQTLARADALVAQGDADGAHRALRSLANRLEAQSKTAKAGATAQAAILPQVLTRLAELNAGPLHNVAQALADNQKIVRLQSATDAAIAARCRMADLYAHAAHEPEHAVAVLKAAALLLGTRMQGAQVRQNLCTTLMAMGNFDAAHAEALEVVERWPNSREASWARLIMGRADYMEGRYPRAAATLEALMDSSRDPETRALAQVEAGNCYQEMGEPSRALEFYYAALQHHPNPSMVQDKITRVRERIYHIAPKGGILNASRPSRHIAAWQPRPTPQDLGVGAPIVDLPAPRRP